MQLSLTGPRAPASSQASIAAHCCGFVPSIGQPLGMIQRPVSRLLTINTFVPFDVRL